MADDKQPGTSLASGSVIIVALVAAAGAYLFQREAPLHGSRPPITEASLHERAGTQTVDARLWQDPLAAVAKAIDKLAKEERGQQCLNDPAPESPCGSPITKDDRNALVIAVTVSAAPYSEDAEQRRRTRYAVLSGLERAGFVPRDARHIGYFWLQPDRSAQPALLAAAALQPVMLPPPAFNVQLPGFAPLRPLLSDEGEPKRAMQNLGVQAQAVPYEWFEEAGQLASAMKRSVPKSILVLWLEEESLKHHPLEKLSELKNSLHLEKEQKIKLIGPYTSGTLRDMVKEACPFLNRALKDNLCEDRPVHTDPALLTGIQFYPYGASAPDDQILGPYYSEKPEDKDRFKTVEDYFGKVGISLQRMIGTDNKLVKTIKEELKLRNARVGPEVGPKGEYTGRISGDLALISEWDTFYGQTLPRSVEKEFRPNMSESRCGGGSSCEWIHKLSYLRGLDGLTPAGRGGEARKQDNTAPNEDKQEGAAGFFKGDADAGSLDRPVGQSQYDYLRRMSKDLRKKDQELRKEGHGRRIKAIGILGSDVFDKLLVLRAFRPEFPEALFFTTDFDEAYTIDSELPWTRNLIIASSFGPKLHEKLQGEIPSFRNSYQTAAFLATLVAVGGENWEMPEGLTKFIAGQLKAPRIFEISRSGEVLSFAGDEGAAAFRGFNDEKQDACPEDATSCNPLLLAAQEKIAEHRSAAGRNARAESEEAFLPYAGERTVIIHPSPSKLFPAFDDIGQKYLAWGLAAGSLLGFALLCLGIVTKGARVEVWLVSGGLAGGALTAAYWEELAEFVTGHGKGEPFALLQGVSVWPTVLLRLLGVILSLYFIWRSQDSLRKNLTEIADNMRLPLPDDVMRDWRKSRSLPKNLVGIILRIRDTVASVFFDFSLGHDPLDRDNSTLQGASLKIEKAWRSYLVQERFWSRRFWRASLYTLLMFGFFWFVLQPMLGQPVTPARGEFALKAYKYATRLDVILMLFLTFFVFDATCFCLVFVNKLRRAKTEWPAETRENFKKRLRLQTDLIHDWIDLEFVARRTRCIGWLIYYPFILIALLILSRMTVFANYPPNLTILVAQGISLSIVFACAAMLWWAATASRDAAKQNLIDEIIWAKGPCAASHINVDAGTQGDSHAGSRDAPQPEASRNMNSEDSPRYAGQLETLLARVEQLRDGAFGPITQQPLIRAVLLPMGSFGWTVMIEKGMLTGL